MKTARCEIFSWVSHVSTLVSLQVASISGFKGVSLQVLLRIPIEVTNLESAVAILLNSFLCFCTLTNEISVNSKATVMASDFVS